MSAQNMTADGVDADAKWLYRVGGIAAIVLALAYFVIIALYVPMGAAPDEVEPKLAFLAANTAAWWAILGLSVLTDFLFIPVALALYLALKGINRNAMLLATAFVLLFVILDLALTWPNYGALITLGGHYAAANETQRAVVVAAATYASVVLDSDLLATYIILVPGIGILIASLVMLKGVFNKATAYLGIATGILGIVSVVGPIFVSALSATYIIASLLTTIWVLLVGYRLYRLGQP